MERHPRPLRSTASPTWGGMSLRSKGILRYPIPNAHSPKGPLLCIGYWYVYRRLQDDLQRANPACPKQMLCKPSLRFGTPYGLYITPRFGQSGLRFAHRLQSFSLTLGQRPRASFKAFAAAGSLGALGMLLAGRAGFARAMFITGVPYALARIPRMLKQAGRSFLGSSSVVPPPPTGAGAFRSSWWRYKNKDRTPKLVCLQTVCPECNRGAVGRTNTARPSNVKIFFLDFLQTLIYI